MKIESIEIKNGGYVTCKSGFYTVLDVLDHERKGYKFKLGTNVLTGDIDSGIWAVSYYLSMYTQDTKKFIALNNHEVVVNGNVMDITEFSKYSCYLDEENSLFKSQKSAKKLIASGLKKSGLNYTVEEIKELFELSDARFNRPIKQYGNERFLAMGAVAYANGKQVFCFPWYSEERFNSFHLYPIELIKKLKSLNTITILPISNDKTLKKHNI